MKTGKLFIITGTSAVGKTTIAKKVLTKKPELVRSITFTTRKIRVTEKEGHDYHFVSLKKFNDKIAHGEFLEWINFCGNFYGTDKKEILKNLDKGKNVLLVIDIKGALTFKKILKQKAVTIFILPDSLAQLIKRFKARPNTTQAEINKRMATAKIELKQAKLCDYQIRNRENQIATTVNKTLKILEKAD
jgi:guanylate kinase